MPKLQEPNIKRGSSWKAQSENNRKVTTIENMPRGAKLIQSDKKNNYPQVIISCVGSEKILSSQT